MSSMLIKAVIAGVAAESVTITQPQAKFTGDTPPSIEIPSSAILAADWTALQSASLNQWFEFHVDCDVADSLGLS